jgi:cysteine synthase B
MSALLNLIGETPLLRLDTILGGVTPGVEIYGKAEWYNLGGSVKDRPALWMIRDGERRGLLRRGMRIADATSGNTGIAYATIGAALGYGVTLALPANASVERRRTLRALGAELLLTDATEGMDRAITTIRGLVADRPDYYFYPDQYSNPANPHAHYETTGPEIWRQTGGRVTHFVAALGTSGTFMGTGRRLREYRADMRLLAVQPEGPYHPLEGVKHLQTTAQVPAIFDAELADTTLEVAGEEPSSWPAGWLARAACWWVSQPRPMLRRRCGLPAQLRSGVVVTILCDSAARYLSERFWEEQDYSEGGGI